MNDHPVHDDPEDHDSATGPLVDRLRHHFTDRAASEPLPGAGPDLDRVTSGNGSATAWWSRPPWLAVAAAAILVAGVVVGAALAGEDEGEGSVDVVAPSTSTTTAQSPTTEVAETTSTTTGATTTTVAPTPDDVRSVVVALSGVLGWWDGTTWVPGSAGAPVPVRGGEQYSLVGPEGVRGAVTGSAPGNGCEIGGGSPRIDVGLTFPAERLVPPPIAVTGVADVQPRSTTALPVGAAYTAAATEALGALGVVDGAPPIVQLLRVDIEGDGIDEVLLTAERASNPRTLIAGADDYSLVLLRQVVDEQVVTTVVHSSVADGGPYVDYSRVAAVADLNGDGVLELVLHGSYYEGSGTAVLAVLPAGGVVQLLSAGCGA